MMSRIGPVPAGGPLLYVDLSIVLVYNSLACVLQKIHLKCKTIDTIIHILCEFI